MIAFWRRAPLFARVVSSTAVGNTTVVARRPRVARKRSGSSFQLIWRETKPGEASRGECRIDARDHARLMGRVDVPKLGGQRRDSSCPLTPFAGIGDHLPGLPE